MVSYSPRAAKAIAQLKKHYNEVEIFVEDTGNHNMWLLILRSLLPAGIRLSSVNMLGGREAVIAACRLDQDDDGRKKIYIIDGDLDYLLGKKFPKLKYFYKIKANNIENLIIHEDAFVSVALEHQVDKTEKQLRDKIKFNLSIKSFQHYLTPLFVAYAVVQKLTPSVQTTGYSVKNLIANSRQGPNLDGGRIARRIISLYLKTVKAVGITKVRSERDKIRERASKLPLSQIASGKDYILPVLMLQFQARCGYGSKDENFKVALARSFPSAADPTFSRRIRGLARP